MTTKTNLFAGLVVPLKVAVVLPAGTVTLGGTLAQAEFVLSSDTTAPPGGAAAVSVTVPVRVPGPNAVSAPSVSESSVGPLPGGGAGGGGGGGGGAGADGSPFLISKLQTADQAPGLGLSFVPRTRHQYCLSTVSDTVNCVCAIPCTQILFALPKVLVVST
jgi:hypothetical protein